MFNASGVRVGGDGVALHDPFDSGFAVDDVLVSFEGNVAQDGGAVVDDDIFDSLNDFSLDLCGSRSYNGGRDG